MPTYAFERQPYGDRQSDGDDVLAALNTLLLRRDDPRFPIGDAAGYKILKYEVEELEDTSRYAPGSHRRTYPIAITLTHVGKRPDHFPGLPEPSPVTTTFYARRA